MIRSDLDLANMAVAIMQFSTQRITAPWLSPTTAQRIAGMLNYFLEHLTGTCQPGLQIAKGLHHAASECAGVALSAQTTVCAAAWAALQLHDYAGCMNRSQTTCAAIFSSTALYTSVAPYTSTVPDRVTMHWGP